MIKIPLRGIKGQGQFTIIDDNDFDLVMQFKWSLSKKGYAQARVPVCLKKQYPVKGVQMQRLLLWDKVNKGLIVDHINGDKLDNRKENLRLVTMSQSNMNRGLIHFDRRQSVFSKYKGVWWDRNKWRAAITVEGKKIYLGRFFNENEAALAYNKAALLYHGEFACLNEIPA
jgi:hypothetical protein